ncbi:PEPxxWA-CTERM sorting domain-containing protein [Phenylobacterium sp.]|uniref:PEPxxWA-CTERM sorting domain-containing protein n=1 Tax=Phenylobacterium sp. TaxID=1871053 RepID=UPI003569DE48
MTQNRSTSKHRRRRTAGLLLSVAALAIAFSVGHGGYRHVNPGSPRVEMALGGGHTGSGGGGAFGHHWRAKLGAGGGGVLSQSGTTDGQHAAYGPGEGDEHSDWGGYMPNGEDGLMTLADFVHGHDGGNNPNQGTPHGWDDRPDHGGKPGPDGNPDGPSGSGSGGGGFGGNGGDGGNGGNGGNGGGGGGGGGGGPGNGPGGPGDGCFVNCGHPGDGPGDGWPHNDPPGGPGDGGPHGNELGSAVPEPAVWMMLILGFGALGSALRVQRRKAGQILA